MRRINDRQALNGCLEAHRLAGVFSAATEQAMELYEFEKGKRVCASGEPLSHLFLLVEGRVKVYRDLPNGRSILLCFNHPLCMIGDLEMLTDGWARNTVEAVSETRFIGLGRQALTETAGEDAAFLRFVVKQLAMKLDSSSNASSLNLLYPVETRFASYLVSISAEENGEDRIEQLKTSSLAEIAQLLGTSYRHLNRVITQFAGEGLVERKRGEIGILALDRLKQIASGNLYH